MFAMVNEELKKTTNIIEREMSEEELRETEERYRILVENANEIILVAQDGMLKYANPKTTEITGYSAEELTAGPFTDFIHPEDREAIVDLHLKRIKGEEVPNIYVFRAIDRDGNTKWMRINAALISWEGRPAVLSLITDVSEQKRVEQELHGTEERYRLQIEHSYDSVAELSKDGVFLKLNTIAAMEMGGKPEDFIGKSLYDVFPKEVADVPMSRIHQVVSSRVGYISEGMMSLPAGNKWLSTKVQPIVEPDGSILSVQTISHDITEERQAQEREYEAYAQGRLEIVDAILHNIGNDLNSVTIGIGTVQNLLTGKLTNYLSSLANAIKEHQDDFSDYVKNDPQGQKVAKFIIALADDFKKRDAELTKTVSRVSERAQSVAEVIGTNFKESIGGRYRKDIDPRKAVDNAVIVLQNSIKERDIEVIIDCDNAPEVISIQESQFHQMLVNFIKNSIEAIDDLRMSGSLSEAPFLFFSAQAEHQSDLSDGVISEGLRQEFSHHRILLSDNISVLTEGLETRWLIIDQDKTYMVRKEAGMLNIHTAFVKIKFYSKSGSLILEVSDNGIGIEENKLETIFRPGYTTKSSGTGTGLHSIENFIKKCNGQIQAMSDGIGKGATMQVILPLE